jgi:hypothetical protein|nr:carboxypeptidase regulatory-like domain-containing protein [Kofleriaceae bacterium]
MSLAMGAAACGGGKGGGGNNPDGGGGGGGGDGGMLPDDGPCIPDSLRCNGNNVETCNAAGTMWMVTTTCQTFCADNACALDGLDITSDQSLDGIVHVKGSVDVHAGATLSSPTGDLTIFADSITIETGGSISVAPTGMTGSGSGEDATCQECEAEGGQPFGSQLNADVFAGSPGGKAFGTTTNPLGGGVLRLLAPAITVSGQITANGESGLQPVAGGCFGGGGASGGSVLLYGDSVTATGSISAAAGLGGPNGSCGGTGTGEPGGDGFVKILFGSHNDFATAMIKGTVTSGIMPPVPLTSTSHPDPTLVYNDGFVSLDMQWAKPFDVQGYYVLLSPTAVQPPTASNPNAMFQAAEKVSFSADAVGDGANYVHIVSVDQQSNIGTIENTFKIQINTEPPSMSSPTNPSQTTFTNNTNPDFAWSYPQGDANVTGAYYVFDHFGLTVPTTTDMLLPATQKQLLEQNVQPGVWVLHVVSVDTAGRLTKEAGHYRINIGTDPGAGAISGTVIDSTSQPVSGATVTVNRGLYTATTDADGVYSISNVTAGTWELSATNGTKSATKNITVVMGMTASGDLTIQ